MSFEEALVLERKNLATVRSDIESEIENLKKQLNETNRQLKAISAFEKARSGRSSVKRSSIRQKVKELIGGSPDGLTPISIFTELDAKGNPSAEKLISNALSHLSKSNLIVNTDGIYRLA